MKLLKRVILSTVISFTSLSVLSTSAQARECMIGETVMFGGNFAPRGWALAQGQLLPIQNNEALFSILGTMYGGDGRTTFALPDLRGRVPVGVGQGPGLTNRVQGAKFGTESVTIEGSHMPHHDHIIRAAKIKDGEPNNAAVGGTKALLYAEVPGGTPVTKLTTDSTGNTNDVTITQPSLAVNFIICTQGVFPARN